MDSAIQLLNNWGLVFHWWLWNRMNYSRRLPLQIWKRPSPANPHCKKPTSQERKEKLWEKVSPFPHWGWVDGELIRNATYRSFETKKYFKTSCAPYRIAWTACCKLEDAVVSHVKNTHPELQTLPQNWRAPSLVFVLEHTMRHFSGQLTSYYILIWPPSLHQYTYILCAISLRISLLWPIFGFNCSVTSLLTANRCMVSWLKRSALDSMACAWLRGITYWNYDVM